MKGRMMNENRRLFEIKYNVLGTRISFIVVSATIEDDLIAGHELCSLSVGNEYKDNALKGVYMHSFDVTKIDHIVLEKEK